MLRTEVGTELTTDRVHPRVGSGRVDNFVYTTGRVGSPTQRVGSDRVQKRFKRVTRGQLWVGSLFQRGLVRAQQHFFGPTS